MTDPKLRQRAEAIKAEVYGDDWTSHEQEQHIAYIETQLEAVAREAREQTFREAAAKVSLTQINLGDVSSSNWEATGKTRIDISKMLSAYADKLAGDNEVSKLTKEAYEYPNTFEGRGKVVAGLLSAIDLKVEFLTTHNGESVRLTDALREQYDNLRADLSAANERIAELEKVATDYLEYGCHSPFANDATYDRADKARKALRATLSIPHKDAEG